MNRLALLVAGCALLCAGWPVAAQDSLPPAPYAYQQLADPSAEAAARALMHRIRCVTCQGQSIADSDAVMAGDMRHEVRSRIAAGQRPEEITASLVKRYGEYISYDPSFGRLTWPLYAVPVLLFLIGGAVAWRRIGRGGAHRP